MVQSALNRKEGKSLQILSIPESDMLAPWQGEMVRLVKGVAGGFGGCAAHPLHQSQMWKSMEFKILLLRLFTENLPVCWKRSEVEEDVPMPSRNVRNESPWPG